MFARHLIVGFLILVPWNIAQAACPDDDGADEILSLSPISSHYVQEIIDRAEDAIDYANSEGDEAPYAGLLFHRNINSIYAAFSQLVDTRLHTTAEQRSLRTQTACLHIDLVMLEALMEKVQCEIRDAVTEVDTNAFKVSQLQQLLIFINERYEMLLKGYNDPTVRDIGWNTIHVFDDPNRVWCSIMYGIDEDDNYTCQQTDIEDCWGIGGVATFETEEACLESLFGAGTDPEEHGEILCPFHSNYLPPTSYGYGCDLEALRSITGYEPAEKEEEALQALVDARDTLIEDAAGMQSLSQAIDVLLGIPTASSPNFGKGHYGDEREHKEVFGCFPDVMEQAELEEDEDKSILYRIGATRWELRGPFSIEKDEATKMLEYTNLRVNRSRNRPFPDYLKLPNEFADENEQDDAQEEEENKSAIEKTIRQRAREFMQVFSDEQEKKSASIEAKISDAPQQFLGEFDLLRSSVKSLGEVASQKDQGARNFVRNFGWYIRRSCIYRPCNHRLTNLLKITLEDTCFPYTNGSFIGNDEAHRDCEDNAGVER